MQVSGLSHYTKKYDMHINVVTTIDYKEKCIVICNYTVKYFRFSRVIKGTDTAQDVDLNSQYFILLGTGETPQGELCMPIYLLTNTVYDYRNDSDVSTVTLYNYVWYNIILTNIFVKHAIFTAILL